MKFSIVLFFLIFLYWHIGISVRIWLGIFLGLIMDSLSLFPFGTYTFIFILAALLVELLRHIFSNTDSLFTKGIAVGSVFFLVNSMIYPVSYVIGKLEKNRIPWDSGFVADIIIWSLAPVIILSVFFGLIHYLNENKKS